MAVYRQVADLIAAQIDSGDLAPGDKVPSTDMLMRTYDIARATAVRAVAELRAAGLIDTENGRVARVRQPVVRETLWLEPGALVGGRMPTSDELQDPDLGYTSGVPLLVVHRPGEPDEVYPTDRWLIGIGRPIEPKKRPGTAEDSGEKPV